MTVAAPPKPAPGRSRARRAFIAAALAPAGLLLLAVLLVVVLVGGVTQQRAQCGTGSPVLPGTFVGPGSLGGVAGTGLTPAQVETVRSSPYAGARVTAGQYVA